MNRLQSTYLSIEQVADSYLHNQKATVQQKNDESSVSFAETFKQIRNQNLQRENVSFSKHAFERLNSRNIHLDETQMERLNNGVNQAKEKCIQESLVMMDDLAFIVNIKNNMVITAMDQTTNDSNVFTNIDGAVIV